MNRPKVYWRPPKVDPFSGKMSVRGRVILGVGLFIVVMYLGLAFTWNYVTRDHIIRQDKPLTYQEMIKKGEFHFPLPSSSEDIYYGECLGGMQDYTCVVRFKAPVKDCVEEIDKVIAWDNRFYGRTSSYPRVNVVGAERPGTGCFESVAWFTPDTINRGIYTGKNSSHTPKIWVDLDRGIFYFLETD